MRCTAVALALFGLAAFASAAPADLEKFESFASQLGESFKGPKDELIRAAIFEKNEKDVESWNADPNHTFTEGDHNENMELTEKELEHDRLGFKHINKTAPSVAARADDAVTSPFNGKNNNNAPLSTKGYNNGKYYGGAVVVDWADRMTPVKDQGKCGSCWAFAAMCVLEARLILKKGLSRTLDLSEQQLVDCSKTYGNMGCEGGIPSWAFNYVKASGKVATEVQYPYANAEKARCLAPSTGLQEVLFNAASRQNVISVPQGNEAALFEGLKTGPVCVSIGVNLNKAFFRYSTGVFTCSTPVSYDDLDHAIVLVGYTTTTYIIRNSWGTSWGTNGYGEVLRRGDPCGITLDAEYPLL